MIGIMSRRKYEKERTTNYLSAKIFGKARITKIETYCNFMDISTKDFIEKAVDYYFKNERSWLEAMTKEQLIQYIIDM